MPLPQAQIDLNNKLLEDIAAVRERVVALQASTEPVGYLVKEVATLRAQVDELREAKTVWLQRAFSLLLVVLAFFGPFGAVILTHYLKSAPAPIEKAAPSTSDQKKDKQL